MKTKRVLTFLALAVAVFSASAQEEATAGEGAKLHSKAKDNWFISIGAGPNLLIGEQDKYASVGDRIKFGGEFSVGKWFNPTFGMRMQVYGGSLKGFNYTTPRGGKYTREDRSQADYPTGYPNDLTFTDDTKKAFWQEFDAMSASLDVMMNLTTLFRGYYRENNLIDLVPYIGIGYQHAFSSNTNPVFHGLVGKLGARMNVNLSKNFSIYLEPQANVTSNEFDGYIGNRDIDVYATVMAGIQFAINKNFSTPGSLSSEEVDALNHRINEQHQMLENQQDVLEQQQRMLNELKNRPAQNVAATSQTINKVYLPDYVRFGLNSSKVEMSEKYKVEDAAAYLKANPASKLLLIGYSDKKTGNSKYNYNLSCKRVESIATLLKENGIEENRLIIQCVGDKEQPYDQNDWNRVVIMVERK